MNSILFFLQLLNGLQLGVLLFLLSAGLTLVFGIMNCVNLAHGSLYMIGAFICATLTIILKSFILAMILTVPIMLFIGAVVEMAVIRHLYARDHLDQVLATFGLILVFDTGVHLIWGPEGLTFALPPVLNQQISITSDITFPIYRILIIIVGLLVAYGLYWIITKTRLGMLVRAGASNRVMVSALGVNINILYTFVFALGAALSGLAGLLIVPITGASIGMGNEILIVAFVVIIIGGIGSVRGAFIAAILIGLIDTLGRSFLDDVLKLITSAEVAETAAPALSAMLIYLLMAIILCFHPRGLFPSHIR